MATYLIYSPSYPTRNSSRMNAVLASGADEAEARTNAKALCHKNGQTSLRDGWTAVRLGDDDLPAPLHPVARFLGHVLLPTDPMPGA